MAGSAPDGLDVRHLTPDDLEPAARAFVTSIGATPKDDAAERYGRYWDVEDSLGAFDASGRLLGVAATWAASFTVEGGAALPCAAVPSVGVRPDSHRRGVGRALLERQVREARDRGAALMALNASESAIYGRYGYGPTSRWWATTVRTQTISWRDDAPRAEPGSVVELDDVDAVLEVLPGLHERVLGGWAGELSRPPGWWYVATHPSEGEPARWAVHHGPDGEVDAALGFRVSVEFDDAGFANEAKVVDQVASDPGAAAMVWRWFLERPLLGTVSTERTDPRLPVPLMLVEPRRFVTRYDTDAAWVRVLDVPRVLGARTTTAAGPDTVSVRVLDPLVAANDRVFALGAEDGHLTVEPSGAPPDVTVPVDALAPLAWGFHRLSSLVHAGRVPAPTSAAALARFEELLATRGPAWCSTGF